LTPFEHSIIGGAQAEELSSRAFMSLRVKSMEA